MEPKFIKNCAPVDYKTPEIKSIFCACGRENHITDPTCLRCGAKVNRPVRDNPISRELKQLENEILFGDTKWWGEFNVICPNEDCPEHKSKTKNRKVLEKVVGFPLNCEETRWVFLCCVCRREWDQDYTKPTFCSRIKSFFKRPPTQTQGVQDWEKNPLLKKDE